MNDWRGCYDSGWQGEITPESFAHPAKVARGLIRQIYAHAIGERWLLPGNTVVDPFGGIGGTALDAMWRGLVWDGVELEEKFVSLTRQNLALWERKYGSKPGWINGRIIQGDSRNLATILGGAEMIVSSPPFLDTLHQTKSGMLTPHQRADQGCNENAASVRARTYGTPPGQLGAMPEGKFDADIGQLGQTNFNTFWASARVIVAQCHQILKPGGYAIWICKDFVRKGKRVPFSDQWQSLCEAQGFELICRHRAMLVANHGTQHNIFGGSKELTTERKSFFRRLAEKKGSPAIDHEDVICLKKSN